MLDPFQFLLVAVAGWMNQHQQHTMEYLREENRVLREQLGGRRLRGSMMTSAADWPSRPKGWGENFWPKSPPWSRPNHR
jgi:hypothetical protein